MFFLRAAGWDGGYGMGMRYATGIRWDVFRARASERSGTPFIFIFYVLAVLELGWAGFLVWSLIFFLGGRLAAVGL